MLMLQYLVQTPSLITGQHPVWFLLHGYGSNADDLFSFAPHLPQDAFVFSLQAPFDMQYGSYAWYALRLDAAPGQRSDTVQGLEALTQLKNTIDFLIASHPIDHRSVGLMGFSQGCIMSYALALTYPERVQKVIGLSGYLETSLLPDYLDTQAIQALRFYVTHGSVDQVVPVAWGRAGAQWLSDHHVECTYKEYPVGHGVCPQNFHDVRNWMDQ